MKIINVALYSLFVALLLGVTGLFLATLLPIPGNIQVKIVKSGSMEPTITTGSIVIVKPQESYAVGNVITFGEDTSTQIPTTHRVVSVEGQGKSTYYFTKGDANEEADEIQIPMRDVIGLVVLSVPYAGYVLDFARQPIGFTLMIGIPAAIIIFDEIFRIFSEVRRMRWRKDEDEKQSSENGGARQPTRDRYRPTPSMPYRNIDGIAPRSSNQQL